MSNTPFVIEVSVEVCNQIGGIHSVLSSKMADMISCYGDRYVLLGPYLSVNYEGVFIPLPEPGNVIGETCRRLRDLRIEAYYGRWLVEGAPAVVLLDPYSLQEQQAAYIKAYVENHAMPVYDSQVDLILSFGRLVEAFFKTLLQMDHAGERLVAHFHEYLAASAVPEMKRNRLDIPVVFTTHATILGRSLAVRDEFFHRYVDKYNWRDEMLKLSMADVFLISLERLITRYADVFTTVSDVMIPECTWLLGRAPDKITPNGLNIDDVECRVAELHTCKSTIKDAVKKHFFPYYEFDLDNTLFFFTSGRNEFNNKGYDLIIQSLGKLNKFMIRDNCPKQVVMFFITNTPEFENDGSVSGEEGWFEESNNHSPGILTHYQSKIDIKKSAIILHLIKEGLINSRADRVKVLYHPAFISKESQFVSASYFQFIQGCDLGIFPSKYEPWGYTSHESVMYGVPTITSNVSGFGQFIIKEVPDYSEFGIKVLNRKNAMADTVDELAEYLMAVVTAEKRKPPATRQSAYIKQTDWKSLIRYYKEAYEEVVAD